MTGASDQKPTRLYRLAAGVEPPAGPRRRETNRSPGRRCRRTESARHPPARRTVPPSVGAVRSQFFLAFRGDRPGMVEGPAPRSTGAPPARPPAAHRERHDDGEQQRSQRECHCDNSFSQRVRRTRPPGHRLEQCSVLAIQPPCYVHHRRGASCPTERSRLDCQRVSFGSGTHEIAIGAERLVHLVDRPVVAGADDPTARRNGHLDGAKARPEGEDADGRVATRQRATG
jgi:hypothetical protein